MPTRKTRHGYGYRARDLSSKITHTVFKPTEGWTGGDPLDAPPGSCVVGSKNIWIENNAVVPREGLVSVGTSAFFGDDVTGLFEYNSSGQSIIPSPSYLVGISKGLTASVATVARASFTVSATTEVIGSWKTLSAVSANGVTINFGGSSTEYNKCFGETVFLERIGEPVLVFGYCQEDYSMAVTSSGNTGYSYLTGSPQVFGDICLFDNSPIAWGIRDSSTHSLYVNRVQWPRGSDIEDWTGVGSGAEDLVDMKGIATRIFTQGDQILLATDEEIWRGRKIGGAYRFQFSALVRGLGIPYPQAAVSTPHGLFWLASDYMVYRLNGSQITPVGQDILQELRDTLYPPRVDILSYMAQPFMSYDPRKEIVELHYTTTVTTGVAKGFAYHIFEGKWTPQSYGRNLLCATSADIAHGTKASQSARVQNYGTKEVVYGGAYPGSVLVHSYTSALDDGQAREAVYISGGIFTGDNENIKLMTEIRADARANSASNLSIHGSGNLGGAFATDSQFAVSVQSNTSQTRVFPKVSGQYHQVKVTSEGTGWKLMRLGVKGQVTGKAL